MAGTDNRIESIVIVGGGTAGWLTAAYLNRALGRQVKITVIESKNVGRIGVGEATVSSWRITMKYLGFDDEDWMHRCNATYKTAIKFVNWNRGPIPGQPDEYFYHPFFDWNENLVKPYADPYFRGRGEGVSIIHYWLHGYLEGRHKEHFARIAFPTPTLCDLQRSPRVMGEKKYEYNTAYHLDAFLVGDFLRDVVLERGVQLIYDDVVEATQDERGFIRSVKTKEGREVAADFFVDCTGFRGLLINQTLKVPFHSENASLLCDSAVAMPSMTEPEKDGINPYTISRTMTSGWMWQIPLFNRDGCGYVYSSPFQSKDSAEKEIRDFLGKRCESSPANHIKMRVGRNDRIWEKNCVAVGLSGCFIEPLESTTIFLIEYALANLVTLFPDKSCDPARARKFNRVMTSMFNEIRDFIIMHYYLANRDDTDFWKAVKKDALIPDSLREQLEFFEESLPMLDEYTNLVFRERSYTCILSGMNKIPRRTLPLLDFIGVKEGYERIEEIRRNTERLTQLLPKHYEYIKWLYENSNKRKSEAAAQ